MPCHARQVSHRVVLRVTGIPTIGLRTTYLLGPITAKVHATWLVLAAAGLGVLAAVSVIGCALARSVTPPLQTLERATAQLAGGRITDPPAAGQGPPELRRLTASLTRTATRLQHLLQTQQAFASEASPQLKTPLTALCLRLENFEPRLASRGPERRQHRRVHSAAGRAGTRPGYGPGRGTGRAVRGSQSVSAGCRASTRPDS